MHAVRDPIRIEVETALVGLTDPQPKDAFELFVDNSNVEYGIGEFGEGGEVEPALDQNEKPYKGDDEQDSDDDHSDDDMDETAGLQPEAGGNQPEVVFRPFRSVRSAREARTDPYDGVGTEAPIMGAAPVVPDGEQALFQTTEEGAAPP